MPETPKPDATAIRAAVRGAVQDVGFREATVGLARRLGVMGWVRNEEDGAVLVHAEGPEFESGRPPLNGGRKAVAFLRPSAFTS